MAATAVTYELALFAGGGGGILGGYILGWRCVGAVEIKPYPRRILLSRQRDGILPKFPIWDDITTFRGDNEMCGDYFDFLRSIRRKLVITGGFPCQDISSAGKGAGITGHQSGLWKEMARVIREVEPRNVFVENSPLLTIRGIGTVLGDLAAMGYDAEWGVLGANDCGANHERKRIFIAASNANHQEQSGEFFNAKMAKTSESFTNANGSSGKGGKLSFGKRSQYTKPDYHPWWKSEPSICRVDDGLAHRMDRIRAIGNGQVPIVAATAQRILTR